MEEAIFNNWLIINPTYIFIFVTSLQKRSSLWICIVQKKSSGKQNGVLTI